MQVFALGLQTFVQHLAHALIVSCPECLQCHYAYIVSYYTSSRPRVPNPGTLP